MNAYTKEILRSIKGSLGRFLAIVGITALGCGFFAGLQMSGRDMRIAADAYYDGHAVWDLRLISTLGFTDEDVERVSAIGGVGATMPAVSFDALAQIGDENIAARVSTLDMAAARGASARDAWAVESADDAYLNRARLVQGAWPVSPDECVMSSDRGLPQGFALGDSVTLGEGTADAEELLERTSFKVVGLVSCADYPYTGSFGTTSLGSGVIEQYLFIDASAAKEDTPYTQIYASVPAARDLLSESDEYMAAVGEVKDRIEDENASLAEARVESLKAKLTEDLDEKRAEYETERADAQAKIDEEQKKLEDAANKIADGERELLDAQAQIDQGEREIANGERELQESRRKLDDAKKSYDDGWAQLQKNEADWQKAKEKILVDLGYPADSALLSARNKLEGQLQKMKDARQQVEDGLAEAKAAIAQAKEGISALKAGISEVKAGIKEARASRPALEGAIAALEQKAQTEEGLTKEEQQQLKQLKSDLAKLDGQIEALEAQQGELEGQLAAAQAGLEHAQAAKEELEAAQAKLPPKSDQDKLEQAIAGIDEMADAKHKLDDAKAQLVSAKKEIDDGEKQYSDGVASLDAARNRVANAKRDVENGVKELADAREQYMEGRAELADAQREMNEKFDEAAAQLDDAQKKIDEIERPDIYVLDRSKSEGAVTYHDDTLRMDRIANVFPAMFFLVAALVALTTMTRMIEDERVTIGTYKALGYSKAAIAGKYLAYAGSASLLGAVVGIAVLSQLLPHIIASSYGIIYTVPLLSFPLPISPGVALLAGGLGVGVTLGATAASVFASLTEVPAALMLPKPPAQGKRIALEGIAPLWERMSFSWKLCARNLFRYKSRAAMTIVGVAGTTALLLTGFGLHDSIWDIIGKQYGPIVRYDTIVGLDDDAIETDVLEVASYLEQTGQVPIHVRVHVDNLRVSASGGERTFSAQVVVPHDEATLVNAVSFKRRVSGERLVLGSDDVFVTEKLARLCGVEEGDRISIFEQDEVGNATGEPTRLEVTAVVENYVGNYVYLGREAWKKVDGAAPAFSTIYASTSEDKTVRANLAAELQQMDDVAVVSFVDDTVARFEEMLSVVNLIVVVLIVSAAALAAIVIYNLTNINIVERTREIASLKVLGFTKREVHAHIFREVIILSLLGALLGLALGRLLCDFVVVTAEVDYVMFGREVHPPSYLYSFALTMAFALGVLLFMRKKLDGIDMVESLKSID